MEKFKFVDLGKFGVVPSLACNKNTITDEINGGEVQIHIVENNGYLGIVSPTVECAGSSDKSDDYEGYALHLFVGTSRLEVAEALRSLADGLEKTLNATQS